MARASCRGGRPTAADAGREVRVPRSTRGWSHPVWHSLFCGLGDFAGELGYRWSNTAAYAYAAPILKQRYRSDIALNPEEPILRQSEVPGRTLPGEVGEPARVRRGAPGEDPAGPGSHPLVFVKLAWLRAARLFTDTAPVGLTLLGRTASVPFVGLASLPILYGR